MVDPNKLLGGRFKQTWQIATIALLLCIAAARRAAGEDWPCWRGPRGDGTSLETNVPTEWNGPSGRNLVWRTPLQGSGHASPIVWGDRIFVVACLDEAQERVLACFDRASGK